MPHVTTRSTLAFAIAACLGLAACGKPANDAAQAPAADAASTAARQV